MFFLIGILFFPLKPVKISDFWCNQVVLVTFGAWIERNAPKWNIIGWVVACYRLLRQDGWLVV